MIDLQYGDEVRVRPTAAHCPKGASRSNVIADPHTGRFMPVAGELVRWSVWFETRRRHGEIEIVHPEAEAKAIADAIAAIPTPKIVITNEVK